MSILTIDGSEGEGGGQIIRTSLALSMITGIPVEIENVRAKRTKPGLMRQHLTAARAAAEVCAAQTRGLELKSKHLVFEPGEPLPGDYAFAIGTAGSAALVLQTILPALMIADAPSSVIIKGGTHNERAPSVDFLDKVFLPRLRELGPEVSLELVRHGFYPAGGGELHAQITPRARGELEYVEVVERGADIGRKATVLLANLPEHIANRELGEVREAMGWPEEQLEVQVVDSAGPGNVIVLEAHFERLSEMFTSFGRKGRPAESVAADVVKEAKSYLAASAPVGEYLADQLLLPMALAGKGRMLATPPSLHTRTQAEILEKFLEIEIFMERVDGRVWEIRVES